MSQQSIANIAVMVILYIMVTASIALTTYLVLIRLAERSLLRSRLRPLGRSLPAESTVFKGRAATKGFEWLLPASMIHKMRESFEERRSVSALPISWNLFILVSVVSGVAGVVTGIFHFHNLLAGVSLGVMGLFLPDQILAIGAGVHRDKTHEQFQLAIQLFAAEYRSERSVQRSLLQVVPQLPEPIRGHFDRAARRLNNGEPYVDVLDELADRLRHPFGRLFINNCKAVMDNQKSGPLFDNIAYQLNQWRIRQTANAAALSGGRTTGLILNGALPIVYLVQVRLQPNTYNFLTETAGGRGLLVLMLLGVLLTFGLNNFLARSEW